MTLTTICTSLQPKTALSELLHCISAFLEVQLEIVC